MSSVPELLFRQAVREHLVQLDLPLTAVLRSLISYRYPPEVFALSFEVFSDSFTSQFPARAFFMDRSNCEYFVYEDGKATYPSPVEPELLAVERIYPEEVEERALLANPDLDARDIATAEFVAWFAACWERAGGSTFPLVATIAQHDSSREFNLVTMQWQPSYASFNP